MANAKQSETVVKRVSRKHEDEGHGGSWKVAFADFCLALMCLFMVLWVLAARNAEEMARSVQEVGGTVLNEGQGRLPEPMGGPRGSLIERYPMPSRGDTLAPRKTPANSAQVVERDSHGVRLSKTHYESPADLQDLAAVLSRLSADSGLASNVQAVVTPYGLRVMLHDTDGQGMFQLGSAIPTPRFRELLRRMGPIFAQIDNQMLVVGHTDSLPFAGGGKGPVSNWSLSSDRAMAARSELLAGGMPLASVLQVVGMADRAPLDAANPAAAANRRIELLILTNGQAQAIAAMFGTPREAAPLMDGVQAEVPDRDALTRLRDGLRSTAEALKRTW